MKMNNIIKSIFIVFLLSMAVMGCKESADISTDPISRDTLFTFTPSHGYPGTTVTLSGSGVDGATAVAFAGILGDNFSGSGSSVTVVVPVGAKSGKISILKANGVVLSLNNFVVDDTPIPTIIDFDPAIAGSGDMITINGSLLDVVDSVFIGELKAEIQDGATATSLQVIAPVGLQTGFITMYYDYMTDYGIEQVGTSVSDDEIILELPLIFSVTPDISALDIGDELIIAGQVFDKVTNVHFGDVEVDPANWSVKPTNDTIIVEVPSGATTGKIRLTTFDGYIESEGNFQVNLPSIESFTPGKGDEDPGNPRNFAIQGANLSLVNEVYLGSTLVTVTQQSNNIILFTADGAASGLIELHTDNGIVTSDIPFLITGDFWVVDFDNTYTPSRYSHFQNNNIGSFASAEGDDGSGTNNCVNITMSGGVNNSSFYLFSPRVTDDGFVLYTPESEGVYLEFDMRVTAIDDTCKQADGSLQFKVYSMDSQSWSAALPHTYGANGPVSYVQTDGDWHHVRLHLADFNAAEGNGGLYTVEQLSASAGAAVFPNSLRILAFVFGTPNESGQADNIVVGFDNIKFAIE